MERGRAGRLVGRDLELSTLDRLLADLVGSSGGLVLVTGEPGIGKSSLLAEIGRRAEQAGADALRGTCWEGEPPSYWPWKQVLRALQDVRPGVSAGRALEHMPEPDVTEFDLYDAVGRALVEEARRKPLVVLLDDLQWADDGSLRLLDFLRSVTAGEPILLVGASRDEGGHRLEGLMAGAVSLPLAGLGREAVVTLMTDVAGPRPPDALVERVAARCRGNPFFVRETARLAFSSGGGWVDPEESEESDVVPAGVRAVLRRRVDQLSAGCRAVLALVAVAGTVEDGVLAAAAGRPDAAGLLDEAEQARITTHEDRRVGFVHDLWRAVVLAEQSSDDSEDLNSRLARALLESAPGPEATGRLAVHLAAAGDGYVAQALQWSLDAARAAGASLGHEEACRHYERALALLDRVRDRGLTLEHPPDRLSLELALAVAKVRAGREEEARGDLAAVAAAARVAGDAEVLADAALAMHALGARTSTQILAVLALLEDASAAVSADDPTRASRLQAARARVLSRVAGRHAEALTSAREATALARAASPRAEFDALLAQHDLLWATDGRVTADGVTDRLALSDELVRVAEQSTDADQRVLARQLRAAVLIELGDPAGVLELVRHCELADDLGTARGRYWATSRRAVLAALDGRVSDARTMSTEARRLAMMMGEPDAIGCDQSLRASLALLGVDAIDLDDGLPAGDPMWSVRHVLSAARTLAGGDPTAAQAEVAPGLPADDSFTSTDLLAMTAWVWAAVGTDAERDHLLAMLEPWAGRHFVVGGCASYYGPVDRLRGDLAAALGRHDDARRWYDEARDAARRLGAPSWARRAADPASGFHVTRDGATWRLTYDGRVAHLPDAKGLHDLATLVANPGRDVHVLTLLGRPGPAAGSDPVLDDTARSAYRQRLADIERELDEADRVGDPATGAALTEERAALVAELASATGLAGRARRLGDESESARKTVSARIRDSLRRVEQVHPELGRHLRDSLSIGTVCRYTP